MFCNYHFLIRTGVMLPQTGAAFPRALPVKAVRVLVMLLSGSRHCQNTGATIVKIPALSGYWCCHCQDAGTVRVLVLSLSGYRHCQATGVVTVRIPALSGYWCCHCQDAGTVRVLVLSLS